VICRAHGTFEREKKKYRALVQNPKKRDHLEDLDVDGSKLKLTLKKWDGRA
jgi:hypothetical protein